MGNSVQFHANITAFKSADFIDSGKRAVGKPYCNTFICKKVKSNSSLQERFEKCELELKGKELLSKGNLNRFLAQQWHVFGSMGEIISLEAVKQKKERSGDVSVGTSNYSIFANANTKLPTSQEVLKSDPSLTPDKKPQQGKR